MVRTVDREAATMARARTTKREMATMARTTNP